MENKINWWIILMGVLLALIVAVAIIWIVNVGNDDSTIIDENKPSYDMLQNIDDTTQATTSDYVKSYYLSYDGARVIIYSEPERNFYDYADINMEVLPPDIREQLKLGMYIDGEDNLYDFLQTYSS
jgi:flagellar basal body-associated protein FliL